MATIQTFNLWLPKPSPFIIEITPIDPSGYWKTPRWEVAGVFYGEGGLPYNVVQHFAPFVSGADTSTSWSEDKRVSVDQESYRRAYEDARRSPSNPNPDATFLVANHYPSAYGAAPDTAMPEWSENMTRFRIVAAHRTRTTMWVGEPHQWIEIRDNQNSTGLYKELPIKWGKIVDGEDPEWETREFTLYDSGLSWATVPENMYVQWQRAWNGQQLSAWTFVAGEKPWGTYEISHMMLRFIVEGEVDPVIDGKPDIVRRRFT